MKIAACSAAAVIILACAAANLAAGELRDGIHIAVREYVVTVSPVDEESRSAESADLYARRDAGGEWENLGPSERIVLPDGAVQFLKLVKVDADGVYQYTSRPIVGGGASNPPVADSPAQAVVIVDTIPPDAEIVRPADPARIAAGASLEIAWTAVDENLAELPASLHWSNDGGDTWRPLADSLMPAGEMIWRAPAGLSGQAALRLTAVDKAGNAGTAVRLIDVASGEPAAAPPGESGNTGEPGETERVETPVPESGGGEEPDGPGFDKNRSWLYYVMAVNLMRQNKPREALRYYWLSVREDPGFINAWADIGLAYIDVGAHRTARDVVVKAREKAPERVDLMHLMGETYHAEAMELLGRARTGEDRREAKDLVDKAAAWYGKALEAASDEWRLAEQAPSFYRLGEICYYVNFDRDGARAYWRKILDLHTPEPNPDLKLWAPPPEWEKAGRRHQRYTHMRVQLDAWQGWARGYLEQLDLRERAGIVDLMPAQKVGSGVRATISGPDALLPPGGDRSLFSLPEDFPSAPGVPAVTGTASSGAMRRDNPAASGYSFYASKERRASPVQSGAESPRRGRSMLSGPPERPSPASPVDPYVFPANGRKSAPWNAPLPYGDTPVGSW